MRWEELQEELRVLVTKIDYMPDVVIGVARGGVIPAAMIARALGVKDMYVIKVRKEGSERRVVTDLFQCSQGLENKKILLVEDMLETGKSLIVAKKYLEGCGADVKTACLYTMPAPEIVPDYFLREVTEVQKFPWE